MPWWVVIRIPGKKMPRIRGPYSSRGKADQRVDKAEEEGYPAKKYHTFSSNGAKAVAELKEQIAEDDGIEVGSSNFSHKGLTKYEEE